MAVISWARSMVANPRVVFFDTETTGFGPSAEIVDLAVIDVSGGVIFESLVRPQRKIPADASRVHGIYDQDVASAPDWALVYPQLKEALLGRPVIVYNADYDRGMVRNACRAHSLPLVECDWHCAMLQYAQYAGQRSFEDPLQFRWHKLGEALGAFGMAPGGHRALSDAEACRRLVLALAETRF